MKKIKRGCVISGGGAWGAFGAGTLAGLNKDYDVVAGISTGALMSPMVALKEWDKLQEAYTSVTQDDIFDKKWYRPSPFKKNGSPRISAILYALVFCKESIATSKNLRKTIDKFLSKETFENLNFKNKEIIVAAQNLMEEPSILHYFSNKDWDADDFKDWMWASANAPFFTSLIKKQWSDPLQPQQSFTGQWTDGGITELVALDEVFLRGSQEIDVIIHRDLKNKKYETKPITNVVENVIKNVEAMRHDIAFEYFDEKIRFFNSKGVRVNVWWLPRKLSDNSLIFDKKQMKLWWEEGFESINDPQRLVIYEPTN